MKISLQSFLNQVYGAQSLHTPWLRVEDWLFDHFAFDDTGAHFIGTGDAPPEQPGISEARQ